MGKIVIRLPGFDECGYGIIFRQAFQSRQQFIRGDRPLCDLLPQAIEPHPCGQAGAQTQIRHSTMGGPQQQFVDGRVIPANTRFPWVQRKLRHDYFLSFFFVGMVTVKADGLVIR